MKAGKVCGTPLQPIGYFTRGKKVHPVFAHTSGSRRIKGLVPYPSNPVAKTPHVHVSQNRVRLKSPFSGGEEMGMFRHATGAKKPLVKHTPEAERTEANLNAKVYHALERKYGVQKTGEIIQKSQEAYHFHNPQSQTSAETYELFEGGQVDEAIEAIGLTPLIIGRPKLIHPLIEGAAKVGEIVVGVPVGFAAGAVSGSVQGVRAGVRNYRASTVDETPIGLSD